jgi:hypothetical protein
MAGYPHLFSAVVRCDFRPVSPIGGDSGKDGHD